MIKYLHIGLILILNPINYLTAQQYKIFILGIPVVEVELESQSINTLTFKTNTVGVVRYLWPVDNVYTTEFDSITFGLRNYSKSIQQGDYGGKMTCILDPEESILKYGESELSVVDSIQTIFTLLARLSAQPTDVLDATWFPMNHEGQPHRARFLLVGPDTLNVNNRDFVCDHYRLDIEKTKGESIEVALWDYFTVHVASDEAIRQIWVEREGKRRIIRASISIYRMNILAELQEKY